MVRRAGNDVAEIRRRRAESDPGSRDINGIPVRIVNGRQGEDLLKMVREEWPGEERARGLQMSNARWGGVSENSSGGDGMARWRKETL